MAKRKFILTEQERKELRRAGSQTDKVPDLQRLQADCLYGEGKPVQEILGMVGGSWRSLMAWYQRCRAEGGTGLASKYQGQNAAKLARQQRWDLVEKLNQYRRERPFPRRYESPKANDPEAGGGEPAVGSQTDPGRVEEAGLLRQDTRQDDSPFFPYFAALPTVGLTGDARIMEELHKISLNSG